MVYIYYITCITCNRYVTDMCVSQATAGSSEPARSTVEIGDISPGDAVYRVGDVYCIGKP